MITSILPTDECNLNCNYCNARKGNNRMDIKTLYNTIDFCIKAHENSNSIGHIEFHAAEPMMMPISFYETAEKRFAELDCKVPRVICSNMTLATPEWYDFIQKYDYGISTSLDGDVFINDHNMGAGAFEKIIKSMADMKCRGISYGCICVLSEYACDHVDELYPFFHHMGQGFKLNIETPNTFIDKTIDAMIKIFDEWYDNKNAIRIDPFNDMINFILFDRDVQKCHVNCNKFVVCVDTKGDVYPCECFVVNENADNYVLGNVNKDTFDDIWYGKKREKFMEFVYSLSDKCKQCPYVEYCGGGCAADSIACGHAVVKNASTCRITRALMDHITDKVGWMKHL